MRRCLIAVVLVAGCAHKPPPAPPPAPPPPPKGDTLRIKYDQGEKRIHNVKMAIDQDVTGSQGPKAASRRMALEFKFVEEATVGTVGPDGTAELTSRLADAEGKASAGADQKMVDDFSLALDELKIKFKRSPLGEVQGLVLSGVRPPLEEQTARAMLNALYSASRGPLLPDGPIDVGGTWKTETALPPSSGFSGLISYNYTYARKGGGVAILSCVGTIDGKGAGAAQRKMTGKSVSEYKLELATGRLIASTVDSDVNVDQASGGAQGAQAGIKQHVHAEWQLKAE